MSDLMANWCPCLLQDHKLHFLGEEQGLWILSQCSPSWTVGCYMHDVTFCHSILGGEWFSDWVLHVEDPGLCCSENSAPCLHNCQL